LSFSYRGTSLPLRKFEQRIENWKQKNLTTIIATNIGRLRKEMKKLLTSVTPFGQNNSYKNGPFPAATTTKTTMKTSGI